MLDLRTGKEMTRRETIKGGLGLAAILAAGKAPAVLLGARGVAFGKGGVLPEGVIAIDYLSSSQAGGQIINLTAFATRIETKFAFNSLPTSNCYIYGKGDDIRKGLYRNGSSYFAFQYGKSWHNISTGVNVDLNVHTVEHTETSINISGVISTTFPKEGINVRRNDNLGLFYMYGYGKSNSRIYYFKTYKEDGVEYDLIPVRVGSVGYMYDKANPTGGPLGNGLYPNSGGGKFILGPDKN